MARSIDERIVDMQFNNRQFEEGIKDSLNSLDNLKKGLNNMDGAAKGLDAVGEAVEKTGLAFKAMDVIVGTAFVKLTNAALNFAASIPQKLFGNMIKGFSAYEEQINAVNAIMNATNRSAADVEEALAGLVFFADETSFSFNQMVGSVKLFTGAGVQLEDAVTAMQGIGSASALAGVNLNEMETVFDSLAKAIGGGQLRLQEWNRLQRVGLGTSIEFKERLLDTAVAMGTLREVNGQLVTTTADSNGRINETVVNLGNLSTTLSENWATRGVLMQLFGDFGIYSEKVYRLVEASAMSSADAMNHLIKHGIEPTVEILEALEGEVLLAYQAMELLDDSVAQTGDGLVHFSQRGFEAAQRARTLTDAMESLSAAAVARWRVTWRLLIGDVDEATKLWSNFIEVLWDVVLGSGDFRNNVLQAWRGIADTDIDGQTILLEGFWNVMDSIVAVIERIQKAFYDIFFPSVEQVSNSLMKATIKFRDFTENLVPTEKTLDKLSRTFAGLFAVLDIVRMSLTFVFNVIGKVIGVIFPMTGGVLSLTASLGDLAVGLRNIIKSFDVFGRAFERVGEIIQDARVSFILFLADILDNIADFLEYIHDRITEGENLGSALINGIRFGLIEGTRKLINTILYIGNVLIDTFKGFFGIYSPSILMQLIGSFIMAGLIVGLLAGGKIAKLIIVGIGISLATVLASSLAESRAEILDFSVEFETGADNIGGAFNRIKNYFKQFGGIDLGPLKIIKDETKELFKPFEIIAKAAQKVFETTKSFLIDMGNWVKKILSEIGITDLESFLDFVFKGGLLALLYKVATALKPVSKGLSDLIEEIALTLNTLRGVLKAFKMDLKASAILKIAIAIGVLTAAIFGMSLIGWDKVIKGIIAIAALTTVLIGLTSIPKSSIDLVKIGAGVVLLGVGLTHIAVSLGILSLIKTEKIDGVVKLLSILMAAFLGLARMVPNTTALLKFSAGLMLLGHGLLSLSLPLILLSLIPFELIMTAFGRMLILIGSLALMSGLIDDVGLLQFGGSVALIAVAMNLLIVPLAILGRMKPETFLLGLGAIGLALMIIAGISQKVNSINLLSIGKSLISLAAGVAILSLSFIGLSFIKEEGIANGIIVLISAVSALLALSNFAKPTNMMGVGKTLATLAGIMIILGAVFLVMARFDVSTDMLIGTLAISGILLAIAGFIKIIKNVKILDAKKTLGVLYGFMGALILLVVPFAALSLFDVDNEKIILFTGVMIVIMGLVTVCILIGEKAKKGLIGILAVTVFIVALTALMGPLYILSRIDINPQDIVLITGLMIVITALTAVCIAIGVGLPLAIAGVVGLLAFIIALTALMVPLYILSRIDVNTEKVILLVGLMTTITALTAVCIAIGVGLPLAIAGVAALLIFVIGLTAVIGIFALLTKAQWFNNFVDNGIDRLIEMAYGIGRFITAFFEGATRALPKIGEDLSTFMTNLQPFIDGAKQFDSSVLEGVKVLVKAIISLTGASIIDAIGRFFSRGQVSLTEFGKQLAEFAPYFAEYYDNVKDIEPDIIEQSADIILNLFQIIDNLQGLGGRRNNTLADVGQILITFGNHLKQYSESVKDVSVESIKAVSESVLIIIQLAEDISKANISSLISFGEDLKLIGDFGINNFVKAFVDSENKIKDAVNQIVSYIIDSFDVLNPQLQQAGKDAIGGLTDGIISHQNEINKVSESIGNRFLNAFRETVGWHSRWKTMVQAGKDAIGGLVEGVGEKLPDGINFFSNAASRLRDSLIPKDMNLIGENMIEELIGGVDSGLPDLSDSLRSMSEELTSSTITDTKGTSDTFMREESDRRKKDFEEQKKMLIHRRNLNQMSLEDELYDWLRIQERYKEGTEERLSAEQEAINAVKAHRQFVSEVTIETLLDEYEVWRILHSEYISGTDERMKVEIELHELQKEIMAEQEKLLKERRKEDFAEQKRLLESKRRVGQITVGEEINEWLRIQKRYAEGADERLQAEQEMINTIIAHRNLGKMSLMEEYELWKTIQNKYITGLDERVRVEIETHDVRRRIQEEQKRLQDEIDRTEENYVKSVDDRARQIASSWGLFTEVQDRALKDRISGMDLTRNLQSQVKELEAWSRDIAKLSNSAIDKGLLAELQKMGPQAGAEIQALASMTNRQLTEYSDLWKKRNFVARQNAINELSELRVETETEITRLRGELDKLVITDFDNFAESGKNAMDAFIEGFETTLPEFVDLTENVATIFLAGLEEELDSFEETGEKLSGSLVEGFKSNAPVAKEAGIIINESASEGVLGDLTSFEEIARLHSRGYTGALSSNRSRNESDLAGNTLSNASINGIDRTIPEFRTRGIWGAEGFCDGIEELISRATTAGAMLARAALNGTERELEEDSPSKVFYEIGKFGGIGFVLGLESIIYNIEDTSEKMGETAIDGIRDAIDKVAEIVDSDIEHEPVITPVLNLSNIQNGIQSLQELFSGTVTTIDIPISTNINRIFDQMRAVERVDQPIETRDGRGRRFDRVDAVSSTGDISSVDYGEQEININITNIVRNDDDINKINRGIDNIVNKFTRTRGVRPNVSATV